MPGCRAAALDFATHTDAVDGDTRRERERARGGTGAKYVDDDALGQCRTRGRVNPAWVGFERDPDVGVDERDRPNESDPRARGLHAAAEIGGRETDSEAVDVDRRAASARL